MITMESLRQQYPNASEEAITEYYRSEDIQDEIKIEMAEEWWNIMIEEEDRYASEEAYMEDKSELLYMPDELFY